MVLSLNLKDYNYDIIIEKDCLKKAATYLNLNRKVLVITDSGVPSEYAQTVKDAALDGYVYTFNQGEENKCFDTYKEILTFLIDKSFTRTDCIVAVGGGVVGDLSGFVAATFMRGIDFYNIPTTLLSQVDSSIGGKTAIDFNNVKNIIGAFYQPKKVLIDSNTLLTLDNRLLNEGLAEAIKMAATFNKDLFKTIKEANNLLDIIDEVIIESLKIKKAVVEEDPFEKGVRKVLNFGHTIGHGIEASLNGALYHGECVALGMMFFTSKEVKKELKETLIKYNLPVSYDFNKEIVFDYIKHDKKAIGDLINVVYCLKLGTYEIKKIAVKDIYDLLGGTNE
ncbi:MAG: 3-dehydroquinate synthase [Bacilli bacterium]|nr:3-dehydroquinate synthase [Bacilli bacterium]